MCALRLITADERLRQRLGKKTILIAGGYKIGKTTLARGLDPETTLFLDFEAGDEALGDWHGMKTNVIRTWDDACDIACLIGGVDPAIDDNSPLGPQPYGPQHHAWCAAQYGEMFPLDRIETIFADSYTRLSLMCFEWARQQPEAWTLATDRRPSVFDPRNCYGLVGRSMTRLLGHLHYSSTRNIIYVGGLELHKDEFGRETWQIEMAGQVASKIAPYIADTIVSYDLFDFDAGGTATHNPSAGQHRAFVCQRQNPFKLPAGDRSGRLDVMEEPDLWKLIDKMNAPTQAALAAQ